MPIPMQQLFDQIHNVPQIPEVVKELINQLHDPNANLETIAKNIEKEQVITLKVLRLVNSAHFGLSRKINSIDEATVLIGLSSLKTLIIASSLLSCMPTLDNFNIKQFWLNSFHTAACARWFAQQADYNIDIAYTAGLFHNLGTVLIHLGTPSAANEIEQHVKNGGVRYNLELNRLGYTSQQVCAELCRRWKLADELVDVIENSANPLAQTPTNPLSCAVYLGHLISNQIEQDSAIETLLTDFPFAVSQAIGLSNSFIQDSALDMINLPNDLDTLLE